MATQVDASEVGFWGGIVPANGVITVHPPSNRVLRLSSAALAVPTGKSASGQSALLVGELDGDRFVVASLRHAGVAHTTLELVFTEARPTQFQAIGDTPIHLTGYVTFSEQEPGNGSDDDDFDDAEGESVAGARRDVLRSIVDEINQSEGKRGSNNGDSSDDDEGNVAGMAELKAAVARTTATAAKLKNAGAGAGAGAGAAAPKGKKGAKATPKGKGEPKKAAAPKAAAAAAAAPKQKTTKKASVRGGDSDDDDEDVGKSVPAGNGTSGLDMGEVSSESEGEGDDSKAAAATKNAPKGKGKEAAPKGKAAAKPKAEAKESKAPAAAAAAPKAEAKGGSKRKDPEASPPPAAAATKKQKGEAPKSPAPKKEKKSESPKSPAPKKEKKESPKTPTPAGAGAAPKTPAKKAAAATGAGTPTAGDKFPCTVPGCKKTFKNIAAAEQHSKSKSHPPAAGSTPGGAGAGSESD